MNTRRGFFQAILGIGIGGMAAAKITKASEAPKALIMMESTAKGRKDYEWDGDKYMTYGKALRMGMIK